MSAYAEYVRTAHPRRSCPRICASSRSRSAELPEVMERFRVLEESRAAACTLYRLFGGSFEPSSYHYDVPDTGVRTHRYVCAHRLLLRIRQLHQYSPRRSQYDDIDTILKYISASSSPRRIRLRAERVGRKHTTINASTRRTATRPRHPSTRPLESHSPRPRAAPVVSVAPPGSRGSLAGPMTRRGGSG